MQAHDLFWWSGWFLFILPAILVIGTLLWVNRDEINWLFLATLILYAVWFFFAVKWMSHVIQGSTNA